MMRIAYCEDEAAQAELVCSMMESWGERRQEFVEVVLFESAEEFLFKNEDFPYDAVFLDIAMRQMNGMELARTIRKKDKKLPIAFLTADKTFAIEGYEVRAVRYLTKPVTAEKLDSLLDGIYDRRVAAYQNKLLKNEVDEVHNIYLTMRGWRHDYHNHMQSVKAYLAMNNLAEAPKTLAVSDIDLCVVIGNLIDNAVEACEKVAPEHQFIRLYIGILQKQLYLSVSNATCETVRKFDEQYISSKRDDNRYLLEFSHVSFRYPGSTQDILKDVSMTFRIGEKLALVGLNGAGKTTLIKLLCRLYEPTAGEIRLNGINIAKYDYEEYIQIFSVVFQDFCLYDFPLEENVASGGAVDSARLQRALELAGIWERIQELPQKEKTLLGHENGQGVLLSGGEAQKVAIARALYKDAPFVILDEPAAALDPFAEAEVYENFNTLVQDKTAVYISHRMSSCKFCDRIVVLDGGRILEEGTHEALLQKKGRYYMLYSTQASYYTH